MEVSSARSMVGSTRTRQHDPVSIDLGRVLSEVRLKASDLLVDCLEAEGVRYIFGVPGEENLDILESLKDSPIQLVVTRHEQTAGFMAATCGRLTGIPGVCLSTLGPGATNLLTAPAYAYLGAMPMVMLTGQKPIRSSKQGAFQIIDVVDMMVPVTKYTRQVVSAAYIPARVREAFRIAAEERPGSTHLEIPEDILEETGDGSPLPASQVSLPVADRASIETAVGMLREARRPLLVTASGVNRHETCQGLRTFVSRYGIPFISTQMGKGVVDERSPCYVGTAALSANDFVHRAVDAADLILNVGHSVVEKPAFFMREGGVNVIHLDFNTSEVDPVYFPQVEVTGNVTNSINRIMERLEPQDRWDFSHLDKIKRSADDHFEALTAASAFPVRLPRLVSDVRRAVSEHGITTLDNGMYKIWFARNYPAYRPNSILLDNALATMGAGLPSAIATRLVGENGPVVAICGDGGFMMNSQELETAVRLGLDLTILVLRDDAYGMIRWKQEQMGFSDFGLTYGNPDFVEYAKAYGATGRRVGRADEVLPALQEAIGSGGVQLLEIPVDYSQDHAILNQDIPRLAGDLAVAG